MSPLQNHTHLLLGKLVTSIALGHWRQSFFIFSQICCNGWFWSAVFHARDLHYTEIMDYLSALSMVLFSVYHMLIRMQGGDPTEPASLCLALAMTSFFFYHSYTSFFVGIYYGYNMFVNLFFGGYLAWKLDSVILMACVFFQEWWMWLAG